jgi:hypothetical protein
MFPDRVMRFLLSGGIHPAPQPATEEPHRLEEELYGKLNLSGSSRSSQFSRIGAVIGSAGAPKVRVIDEIEELGSKLEPGALVDRKVLKDREIDSDVPRTADRISTDVSELAGHRVCKRSRVKPLLPAAPT